MSKEENIKHFKLRRKRHDNSECPICCEENIDCIPRDCVHYYCLECYAKIVNTTCAFCKY